MKSHISRQIKN